MTEQERKIEELQKENKALKNRCFATSRGTICKFCSIKCEHKTTKGRGGEE